MNKTFISFTIFCLMFTQILFGDNVGLLIMATGKYIQFVPPLISSAEKYFCVNHNVTYFVFTDGILPPTENTICIYQPKLGWPYDSMMRSSVYASHADELLSQDYLFALDADMLFVDFVGEEIFGERVATQHPCYVGIRGTYETNPLSSAYISSNEGEQYFAGGFYGGSTREFIRIVQTLSENVDIDLKNGIIAIWHDESHWNRYCIDHKPTVILNPSYCYPENWDFPYPKKLLALDKNHNEMRE